MRKKSFAKRMSVYSIMATILFSIIFVNDVSSQDLIKGLSLSAADVKVCEAKVTRTSLDNQRQSVQYYYNNDTEISPYTVEYDYIQSNSNEYVLVPIKSYLADLDMYFDKGVSISSLQNDEVILPNTLEINQLLESVETAYSINIDDLLLLEYHVELSDRKVQGIELIDLDGVSKSAYIIASKLDLRKLHNGGQVLSTTEEMIYDWFVPNHGIVKRQRTLLANGKFLDNANVTQTNFN